MTGQDYLNARIPTQSEFNALKNMGDALDDRDSRAIQLNQAIEDAAEQNADAETFESIMLDVIRIFGQQPIARN